MPDARCESCAHWDHLGPQSNWRAEISLNPLPSEDEDDRYTPGSPYQERVRAVEARYGMCKAITLLDSYETQDEADVPVAFCRDGSDYKADLYTRVDFGCTLWEPSQSDPA